jgi:hypothetical protein
MMTFSWSPAKKVLSFGLCYDSICMNTAHQVPKMSSWTLILFQMLLPKFRRRSFPLLLLGVLLLLRMLLFLSLPHPREEASPEFMRDLDLTIRKGNEPIQDVALLETREDLPEGQDPSPSVAAFNKSIGTSHRGELL